MPGRQLSCMARLQCDQYESRTYSAQPRSGCPHGGCSVAIPMAYCLRAKRTGYLYCKATLLRLRWLIRGRDALTVGLAHCGLVTQKKWFLTGPM